MFTLHEHANILNVTRTEATPGKELLDAVVTAVHESTGLQIRTSKRRGSATDKARFDTTVHGRTFLTEIKPTIDRVAALTSPHAKSGESASSIGYDDTLLVTRYLSNHLLDAARELKVNVADASGNACLQWDDTLILVSGRRRLDPPKQHLGWTGSAVRLGLLALASPEVMNETQRFIAAAAGVSLGSVGPAVEWLEERRFIVRANGRLTTARRSELLTEWSVAYSARVRPKLRTQRFIVPNDSPWWKTANVAPAEWSGEVAAAITQGNLKPTTAELYVDPTSRATVVRRLVSSHRLAPDPAGPLAVVERFWSLDHNGVEHTVPWPLIYADLLHIGDPRTTEAGWAVREASDAT